MRGGSAGIVTAAPGMTWGSAAMDWAAAFAAVASAASASAAPATSAASGGASTGAGAGTATGDARLGRGLGAVTDLAAATGGGGISVSVAVSGMESGVSRRLVGQKLNPRCTASDSTSANASARRVLGLTPGSTNREEAGLLIIAQLHAD